MFMAKVLSLSLSQSLSAGIEHKCCKRATNMFDVSMDEVETQFSLRYVTLRFLAVGFVSRSSCSPAHPQLTTRHATTTTTTTTARSLALVLRSRVRSWQHVAATCQPSDLTFGNCLSCCCCCSMQPINRQTEQSTCVCVCVSVTVCVCVSMSVCDLLQAVINLRSPLAT